MNHHFDAIVAGAGIVGAACAASLARTGMHVALVDRGGVGSETTSAGMGHIVVLDDSEAQFALTRYSQRLWQELAPTLAAEAEYEALGTVWVAANDEELAEAERKSAYYNERGVPAKMLSSRELAEYEPNLRAGLAGGLFMPQDAIVNPPAVAMHLVTLALAHGAELLLGCKINSLRRGEAVLEKGGVRLTAPLLINATCGWATDFDPGLPIRKRKGHLVLTEKYPDLVRHQVAELGYLKSTHAAESDSVVFNVQPRPNGQILIGASRQYDNEDTGVDKRIVDALLKRAAQYMPALGTKKMATTRVGFRAATPDKLPLIGPVPDDETLWLATGHEGLGITTSLGTAALIAAALTGLKLEIPIEPYLPARFDN
jgi:glycine/D-amino acid oxidase-like deaminating enzyme